MINNEDFNTAKIKSFYKSLFENNQEIMLLINPETSEKETNAMMEETIGALHKANNMLSAIFES